MVGSVHRPPVNQVVGLLEHKIMNSVQLWHRQAWLLDHVIRPHQHIRHNRHAELLRCFQVDHELKLRGLFDRQFSGIGALRKVLIARPDYLARRLQ